MTGDRDQDRFVKVIRGRGGNLARISGDLARCVAFSRQALDLLPETHFTWKVSKLNATYAYQVSGEVTPTTERLVADAIATVRGTGNPLTILRSVINLAQLQVLQGRLQQAVTTFEEAARSSSGPGGVSNWLATPPTISVWAICCASGTTSMPRSIT
jgi:hypothetical protein